ncbi:HET-domain-containing protein [Lindgomyces ingoldianus]|uniref:HET-domain-containing protein n=1 Tax=Lindgomyces ingoldianus TaxID=673940 RepID=A0ACB6QM35_9PLEO|nr:HET-domain-containing protein [Lindgomyces ingoldianus]KAF2468074.1 HET-domain-containing protein [Lindgomyces ingoldianus]
MDNLPLVEVIAGCHICHNIGAYAFVRVSFHEIHASSASGNGCIKCSVLWKVALVFIPDRLRQSNTLISFRITQLGNPKSIFNLEVFGATGESLSRHIVFFTTSERPYVFGQKVIDNGHLLEGKTSSRDVWRTVRYWLADCVNQHRTPACYRDSVSASNTLPTRVLDLGRLTNAQADIMLHETQNGEAGVYMCLSHCWGPQGCALKTTSQNLGAHKNCISFEFLPQTFKDAVIFTRWLGIRYLWIDSLCIIQDSDEDWELESGAMAQVYENSYLTLSAAKASCDSEGMFMDEERSTTQYYFTNGNDSADHLPLQNCDASSHQSFQKTRSRRPIQFYMRESIFHSPIDGEFYERESHPSFPLLSRAWAFQERILSPRVLHFGGQELYWECRQETYCECGHKGIAKSWAKREYGDLLSEISERVLKSKITSPSSLLNHFTRWKRLVEKYSQKHLSFPIDRLPALSGLASRMQNRFSGTYLAGIWQSDTGALIWHVNGDPEAILSQYIAPSWSWASVNRGITYIRIGLRDEIFYSIVEAMCVPLGLNPAGQVSSGYLIVKGQYETVKYNPVTEEWYIGRQPDHLLYWDSSHVKPFWDSRWEDPLEKPLRDLILLRLVRLVDWIVFLILQKMDAKEETVQRVGLLKVDKFAAGEEHLNEANCFCGTTTAKMI